MKTQELKEELMHYKETETDLLKEVEGVRGSQLKENY